MKSNYNKQCLKNNAYPKTKYKKKLSMISASIPYCRRQLHKIDNIKHKADDNVYNRRYILYMFII